MMHDSGKSDNPIVPEKAANKGRAQAHPAEQLEGRGLAKGNSEEQTRFWTQGQTDLQHALDRIRKVAKEDKDTRFTALWHHVINVNRLRESYMALRHEAAPGVDGETWHSYGENLEANLKDLSGRLKRNAYRARPVKRAYILKGDGKQRPLGIMTLEDKIVQRATVKVLNAIYEEDFFRFSYGYRPESNPHKALDAVTVAIKTRPINWVLDADIRGFFDAMDHEWILRFLEHRIADRRVLRHVVKWLKAGILEDGEWRQAEEGAVQGGNLSPLLANIYLHHALDQWAHWWRTHKAAGTVVIVRFADDFVVGFQHKADGERFREELEGRLGRFGLELHPEKTRLIAFGRKAGTDRQGGSGTKPGTFDFLGFTHFCGKTRRGKFRLGRKTMAKRKRAKLADLAEQLRQRMHWSIPDQGRWLKAVLTGHYRYYGVPGNIRELNAVRYWVTRLWWKVLMRRSHKARIAWSRMAKLEARWLPPARIYNPYPESRFYVSTRGRSPVR